MIKCSSCEAFCKNETSLAFFPKWVWAPRKSVHLPKRITFPGLQTTEETFNINPASGLCTCYKLSCCNTQWVCSNHSINPVAQTLVMINICWQHIEAGRDCFIEHWQVTVIHSHVFNKSKFRPRHFGCIELIQIVNANLKKKKLNKYQFAQRSCHTKIHSTYSNKAIQHTAGDGRVHLCSMLYIKM